MWLARDMDGSLWLYERKPVKGEILWDCLDNGDHCMRIGTFDTDSVRWEDDEPYEVGLISREYIHDSLIDIINDRPITECCVDHCLPRMGEIDIMREKIDRVINGTR